MSAVPVHEPERIEDALLRAVDVLARTQTASGSWEGDYAGPLFLPGMLVGVHHVLGEPLDDATADGLVRWLRSVQNDDGGYGVGIENPSCLFTSLLTYVALRLLGVPEDDPQLVACRAWFTERGGPLRSASWGRFFLAVLGLYDWSGLDPVPPEAWLLPRSLPVHPGRLWCHARMVYLPMSWLYGRRATGPITPIVRSLRRELYAGGYDRVDWAAHRDDVAPEDAYVARTGLLRATNRALGLVEAVVPRRLRERALAEVLRQIDYEDRITAYRCIGPVNKLYDLLVQHFARPGGPEVRAHLAKLPVYLWTDEEGTKVDGYDSSELWDTAFATQALLATGEPAAVPVVQRAHAYVDAAQVREDPPDRRAHYRCRSRGAWPFSTREHGWPITDCTAEGLLAALGAADHVDAPLDAERLRDAAERLLDWQNRDGSWASYERTRGPAWLESLNPSDVFGDIMIDRGHVECSASSMVGLAGYRRAFPGVLDDRIDAALERGVGFLRRCQRDDGGWLGGWAVCFTYGTWFALRGLRAAGVPVDDPAIRRAVAFLRAIQLHDGGWGEHVDACRLKRPVPTPHGEPVQTAWAVLALIEAGEGSSAAARRGVRWLLDAQADDGTWTQRHVVGVFNRTCSITYHAYPKVFPLWALARARGPTPAGT